jgi:hypothetical protein
MGKYHRPPFELTSKVGSNDKLPVGLLTQHRVKIRNLSLREIWVGFTSCCTDDSIRYAASPDATKWEPHKVKLQSCDNHASEFEFADMAGALKASPPPKRMTQLLLTARSQLASPSALVPASTKWMYPLHDAPENVSIV